MMTGENSKESNLQRKNYKLTSAAKDLLLQMIAEKFPYNKISDKLKERFGVTLTGGTISFHAKRNVEEITDRQINWVKQDILQYPISHKEYRLRELQKIYNGAKTKKEAVAALRAAKAEIGEDIEKIADALRVSGGDNYVNIGVITSGEAEAVNREASGIVSVKSASDRF